MCQISLRCIPLPLWRSPSFPPVPWKAQFCLSVCEESFIFMSLALVSLPQAHTSPS